MQNQFIGSLASWLSVQYSLPSWLLSWHGRIVEALGDELEVLTYRRTSPPSAVTLSSLSRDPLLP